jgi:hypothetical protein
MVMKAKPKFPYTNKPPKRCPFPVPIPPLAIVSVKRMVGSPKAKEVGRQLRIGYYSKMDGFDFIWLVDENGKCNQSLDHQYLNGFGDSIRC